MGLVVLVLCVACVALYACGVRRFYGLMRVCLRFSLFLCVCPAFGALPLLLLVFPALSLLLVLLFPFRSYRAKRKGASSLRPLLVCCGFVYMFRASLSESSFAFENIHPAPQER